MSDPETGVRTRYLSTNIDQSTTMMNIPSENLYEQMRDVINLWHHESNSDPAWIEGDDDDLISALRKHFHCGARPDDWENSVTGPPTTEIIDERAAALSAVSVEPDDDATDLGEIPHY